MAPRPIPAISPAVLATRTKHFIMNMFMTYRLDSFQLPLPWLKEQLCNAGHDRVDILELRNYLRDECGMQVAGAVTRNRIPVGWDEDNKSVLYLTEGVGRPYTFRAAEWLTEEEMAQYGLPVPAAA